MGEILVNCQKCGCYNDSKNVICSSCGVKLTPELEPKLVTPLKRERRKKKRTLKFAIFSHLISFSFILFFLALVLTTPSPKQAPSTVKDLAAFYDKVDTVKQKQLEEIEIYPEELTAFIEERILAKVILSPSGLKKDSYFTFPQEVDISFQEKNFSLSIFFEVIKIKLAFTFNGSLEFKRQNLLVIKPNRCFLGKLPVPKFIIRYIAKVAGTSLTFKIPFPLQSIELAESKLFLINKAKTTLKKTRKDDLLKEESELIQPETTIEIEDEMPQSPKTETLNKEENIETEEAVAENTEEAPSADLPPEEIPVSKYIEPEIAHPQEEEDKTAANKKTASPKSSDPKEEKAKEFHRLGNYFYQKKQPRLALKYYKKIIKNFPNYSNISAVKEKIESISLDNTFQELETE